MATKSKTKPKTILVRIIPPNKRLGHFAETYTLSGSRYPRFDWRRGWYEVDLGTARRLKDARNNANNIMSRPVFQICTHAEAKALDVTEKQAKAEATAPIPLPTKVHKPNRPEVQKIADEAPTDDEMDLSDDDADDDWDALTENDEEDAAAPEAQETADKDDLEDLDDLVTPEPEPAPKRSAKKATKKKSTRRATKKKPTGGK